MKRNRNQGALPPPRWAWPPGGLFRYASLRLRSARPSEPLPPKQNQPLIKTNPMETSTS